MAEVASGINYAPEIQLTICLVHACVAIVAALTDSGQSRTPCCYLCFVSHDKSQHNMLLAQARPMILKNLPTCSSGPNGVRFRL